MVQSALIGQPAATQEDYYIAKALLQAIGKFQADPWQGVPLPPKRPPPGLYRAESRAATNITAYSIAIAVISIITLTRLYLRATSRRMRWGLDDWIMCVALVLVLAWPTLGICAVKYGGVGRHMYDVTYHEFATFKYIASTQSIVFYLGIATIKMSIIAFNMRLTGLTSKRWMIFHWTFFTIMVIYFLLAAFLNIFRTDPARARYDLVFAGKMDTKPRNNLNSIDLAYAMVAIHIASDVLLLSFFGIILWKLQTSRAVRARIFVVFSIGAMSFIAAVKWQLANNNVGADTLWDLTEQIRWSLTDLTCGMTAASLPILSTLFVQAFNSIKGSLRSYTGGSSRTPAGSSGKQDRFAESTPQKQRRWPGQSLLAATTHSNDSQMNQSIYAETPGFERPFGHVEGKEQWTTTRRHHEEGYSMSDGMKF